MAEQTFKSPGFFEREIEIISRPLFRNTATPAGLIGTSERGPAFVPTTVSSREEFIRIFGAPHRSRIATHAMAEFFRNNGKALTFCRTLGSGDQSGNKAGFKLTPRAEGSKQKGAVHFIAATHVVSDAEFIGLGVFNDNDSHTTNMDADQDLNDADAAADSAATRVELIRAAIFAHKDCTVKVKAVSEHNTEDASSNTSEDTNDSASADSNGEFIIVIHNHESDTKKYYKISLNPDSENYISKVLNTDSFSFEEKNHYLYAHFPVDVAVASLTSGKHVSVLHGDTAGSYNEKYGEFDTPFKSPRTPLFISQPFGKKEYNLFHFESIDDGEYANFKYKVSISNIQASTDPTNNYGTFTVAIRDLKDNDDAPVVFETFNRCSLDPNALNFIGRVIGDQKLFYDYTASSEDERRLVREGSFKNVSQKVRVVVHEDVLKGEVPDTALPFGYRGVPALLGNSAGTDGTSTKFLVGIAGGDDQIAAGANLNRSVLPPLPYRFKVTKGTIKTGTSFSQTFLGEASPSESVNLNYHWGLMSTRVTDILDANKGTDFNEILLNYGKFLGKSKDVVADDRFSTTEEEAADARALMDSHNNNKFSLSKVALKTPVVNGIAQVNVASISGTINDVFKDAVYVRNADPSSDKYDSALHLVIMNKTNDPFSEENAVGELQAKRMSLAKILAEDKVKFNKYSLMAKFTAPFYGGFDGLNILDRDSYFMTDKSASIEDEGKASDQGFSSGLLNTVVGGGEAANKDSLMQGYNEGNNIVASYRNAIRVMTDDLVVNHNILAIPDIKDPFTTDHVKLSVEEYGKALYLMDIPQYTLEGDRIFVDAYGKASGRADVDVTSSSFDAREVNSSYVATYFPDVRVLDSGDDDEAAVSSRRSLRVPPSVVALGALAKTDDETQPWFAPAGFSRGALNTISSIDVRLNAEDRDTLYEARINPIANFPNKQFVIFGQKTSQLARTALDRVNVRRLVLEVKRRIEIIAQSLLFEQNTSSTRATFVQDASLQLAGIQVNQGIEDFRVIMDETNNSSDDVDNNRLNGKIIIVPTRAVEFIAIDFVITNSGVEFP